MEYSAHIREGRKVNLQARLSYRICLRCCLFLVLKLGGASTGLPPVDAKPLPPPIFHAMPLTREKLDSEKVVSVQGEWSSLY